MNFLVGANALNDSPFSNDCATGEGGFSPGLECTLSTQINTTVANFLPAGVYHASYQINVSNSLTTDIPQPEPITVFIDLVVTPAPTVTLAPNPINFTEVFGCASHRPG